MIPRKINHDDWQKLKALLINSCKESPDAFSAVEDENTTDHTFKGYAKKWSRGRDEVAYILSNNQGDWGIILGSVSNIGHFWVDPKIRGKGHGKKLLGRFLDWARERHVSNIYAFVTENSKAIDFYKSAGFIITSERAEIRPRSGKSMIKMELETLSSKLV